MNSIKNYGVKSHGVVRRMFLASDKIVKDNLTRDQSIELCEKLNKEELDNYVFYAVFSYSIEKSFSKI